ncbi:MAG: ABC transporter substrate-binding protein, partial [Dehalococcoidales bacterium]
MLRMKQIAIFILVLGVLSAVTTGCQTSFQPGTYTDDMGREVNIEEAPQRIVSHVPPITEILFALELDERVVGVSDFCDYPEEAKSKPSVGNYYNPSIESIVALDPDLVLTDGHSESIQQLDNLGINYLVIDPKDIDDIFEDIELIGDVIGIADRARQLIYDMKADISS